MKLIYAPKFTRQTQALPYRWCASSVVRRRHRNQRVCIRVSRTLQSVTGRRKQNVDSSASWEGVHSNRLIYGLVGSSVIPSSHQDKWLLATLQDTRCLKLRTTPLKSKMGTNLRRPLSQQRPHYRLRLGLRFFRRRVTTFRPVSGPEPR